MKDIKLLWQSSFVILALSGCQTVTFPDVTNCSVAGIIAAGMDCAATGHDENTEMNVKQTIDFLEAGAICMSAEDRKKEKTAAERACVLLKDRCTFEMKQKNSKMDAVKKRK